MARTTSANADGVFEPFRVDELPWQAHDTPAR
jgi:hypothetical protein